MLYPNPPNSMRNLTITTALKADNKSPPEKCEEKNGEKYDKDNDDAMEAGEYGIPRKGDARESGEEDRHIDNSTEDDTKDNAESTRRDTTGINNG